ncbi:unnamed protein product [Caenorhabditis auriculariae]|uniref:Serpentine receptor class gamma n=1 Tax=Caenorhabditis auriculariae TaxID=2777116 RepID=A0A8S1HWK3_9PELO|nr:unnamed protein product [Caenorhabditis auriculariae]
MEGFIARLCYRVPAATIYILVVITLRRNKANYVGSFFKLFMFSTFVNLAVFINATISLQILQVTPVGSWLAAVYLALPQLIVRIIYMLSYYFGYVQFFIIFLMAMNRFTVIFLPFHHEKFWDKFLWISIAFCVIAPFASVYPLLCDDIAFQPNRAKTNLVYAVDLTIIATIFKQLLMFMVIVVFLTLTLNVAAAYQIACNGALAAKKAEFSLYILSVYNFLLQLGISVFTYIAMSESTSSIAGLRDFTGTVLPYISDMVTFSNAFVVLFLNRSLRKQVFSMLLCKCEKEKTSSIFLVANNSNGRLPIRK